MGRVVAQGRCARDRGINPLVRQSFERFIDRRELLDLRVIFP